MIRTLITALCTVLVTGCISTTPVFGGKVHVNDAMKVTENPDGTRSIERTWQGDMPAGALADAKANFFYDRDADGATQIDTGGEGSADTVRQAALLEKRSGDELQMFLGGVAFGESLLEKAMEYFNIKLPLDAAQEAQETANEHELRKIIAPMIDQRIGEFMPMVQEQMGRQDSQITNLRETVERLIEQLGGLQPQDN